MIKNKLSELMGRKRIIMAEVVRLSGLNKVTVSDIYHDKSIQIAFATINKLCWALDCKVEDLFEYVPDEKE